MELGVLLVAVVLGDVEEDVVASVDVVALEAGADVVDVEAVELVEGTVVEEEGLLDSAKYAAAAAAATIMTMITAKMAVAIPLEEVRK